MIVQSHESWLNCVEVASALATYGAATATDISTSETNIRGTDNDTLKTISDQIDNLETPAMLG